MKSSGLVTIVCICYNHESWIQECLESVKLQDYPQKELIIIDNGSSDNSLRIIQKWVKENSGSLKLELVSHKEPQSYLKVFNDALRKSKSQYIVDLAGDDLLYPDHLSLSIARLKPSKDIAFVFSDAYILDEDRIVKTFYDRKSGGELKEEIELGKIYETLIQSYSICAPTIVFNRDILVREGGYDENLSYEDFDIQVRLSRKYPLVFSDHVGVLKRKHLDSLSSSQYIPYYSKMLPSTLLVCQKIKKMNETESENIALKKRILFELKHALWSANFKVARGFIELGDEINIKNPLFMIYKIWLRLKIDLSWLYTRLT
ncbi:glycosyltransferase [Algoriphagus sp. SE2]|uniref:glycosyltransferase n=1 Tax=Algoriphagus sp. SE2 TaxID=3141536 RepID=UPI0031CDA2CB